MGSQSALAFASRDQAEQFLRSNGGVIKRFHEIPSP
jgi:nitrous oxide reductase accessory protein NosL